MRQDPENCTCSSMVHDSRAVRKKLFLRHERPRMHLCRQSAEIGRVDVPARRDDNIYRERANGVDQQPEQREIGVGERSERDIDDRAVPDVTRQLCGRRPTARQGGRSQWPGTRQRSAGRVECRWADGKRRPTVEARVARDIEIELAPDRAYRVGGEFDDRRVHDRAEGVQHGPGAKQPRHERAGEHVGVVDDELRREFAPDCDELVDGHRCPDLAEQPGHEIALHTLWCKPVTRLAPSPCRQRGEPVAEPATGTLERQSSRADCLGCIIPARDDHLVTLSSKHFRERHKRREVSGLRNARYENPHSFPVRSKTGTSSTPTSTRRDS